MSPGAAFCSEDCLDAAAAAFIPGEFRRGPERVKDMREALESLILEHPDVKKLQAALDESLRQGMTGQAMKIAHVLKEFAQHLMKAHGPSGRTGHTAEGAYVREAACLPQAAPLEVIVPGWNWPKDKSPGRR